MKIRAHLRAVGAIAALAAILVAGGGHWLLLQSIAWGGMVVSFSRTDSLAEAIEKTFDGEHPCPLCKKVQRGRQAEGERQPQAPASERTPELLCEARKVVVPAPFGTSCAAVPFPARRYASHASPPPKPPPKPG